MKDFLTYRSYSLIEMKGGDTEDGVISGYASTYTQDAYGDRIVPGAFAGSIHEKRGKFPIFLGHDPDKWVGFTTQAAEDAKGLAMAASLNLKTTSGRDAFELVKAAKAADYNVGLSIGFIAKDFEMDGAVRLVKEIDLWEISITPFPANRMARVTEARSFSVNAALVSAIQRERLKLFR